MVTIDLESFEPPLEPLTNLSSLNSFVATDKNFVWDFNTGTHNQAGNCFDVKGSGAKILCNAEIS